MQKEELLPRIFIDRTVNVLIGLIFLLLIACSSKVNVGNPPIADLSNISASISNDPIQENARIEDWTQNGYKIHALAKYELEAKILGVETYSIGRESELSPADFVLGWGPMSNEEILKKINISQSHRWYHWSADSLPLPREVIESHSANTHIIPASKDIEKSILSVSKDDIVKMRGYLVRVDANDGWHWQSSLSRTDTGGGSCELFWVEKIDIN